VCGCYACDTCFCVRCQYQSITVYNVFTFKVHAAKVEKVDEGSTEKESEEEGRVEEKMAVVECCFVDCNKLGVLRCSYCDYVCCLGHLRRLYSLRGQVCDICDAPLGLPGPPWGPPEDPFRIPRDWPQPPWRPAILPIVGGDRSRSRSRSF